MAFLVPKQTNAENDKHLLDCFHDANFINPILNENYSIISGRKGTGKTALAKYLQGKYEEYDLDLAHRISIDEIGGELIEANTSAVETILLFIITETVKLLLKKDLFSADHASFWKDFLHQNNLHNIDDYRSFLEWTKKRNMKIDLKYFSAGNESEFNRTDISSATANLFSALVDSIFSENKMIIFIDDLTDHLDRVSKDKLKEKICVIRDVLLRLEKLNSMLNDSDKKLSFICCIREDIWEFMEGSNINKLKNNAFKLKWNEKSFCSMLIRRLPFFVQDIDKALEKPEHYIKKQFPNDIFSDVLKNSHTKTYQTNFYAYIVSITFNRPRDFLKFCWAMRERLSETKPVKFKSIEASEIEYTDYFLGEFNDEFYLISKMLNFDDGIKNIRNIFTYLSKQEGFSYGQLKSELPQYFGKGSGSKKTTYELINHLWWYGILGFQAEHSDLINFNYMDDNFVFPLEADVTKYRFFLHRGIYWSMVKNRKNL